MGTGFGADAHEKTRRRLYRKNRNLEGMDDPRDGVPREGNESVEGVDDAFKHLKRTKSRELSPEMITPDQRSLKFPEDRSRMLEEFYGAINDAGGLEAVSSGDAEGQELERYGITEPDGTPTDLVADRIPDVIDHEGGKYSWLQNAESETKYHIIDTLVSGERDGRRLDALQYMNARECDPEALEDVTDADIRDMAYDLGRQDFVEFSRNGLSTTEKGKQLVHFMNESYREMEKSSQSRAEAYLDIADAVSEYGDSVLEPDAVNVSGHRELVGRILERKRGEIPSELEAFEDY